MDDFVRTIVDHSDSFALGSIAILCVGLGSFITNCEGAKAPADVLTAARARRYPYIAAVALTSLNVLFERLGPTMVNFTLMFYFGLAGANAIWFLLRTVFRPYGRVLFMFPKSHTILTEFVLPGRPVPFHASDVPLYLIGVGINLFYYQSRDNITNNVIAGSIAMFAVMSIRIEKFTSAAPMLWSLLIYDVFFVYSTDVMQSVARNIQGPVKLVYGKERGMSILGLGDIVLPGLFLSVCARFDQFMKKLTGRWSPYWTVAMIGYVVAIVTTDVVCYLSGQGQPALLFITPLVTVPTVALALYRRERYAFMSFSG